MIPLEDDDDEDDKDEDDEDDEDEEYEEYEEEDKDEYEDKKLSRNVKTNPGDVTEPILENSWTEER